MEEILEQLPKSQIIQRYLQAEDDKQRLLLLLAQTKRQLIEQKNKNKTPSIIESIPSPEKLVKEDKAKCPKCGSTNINKPYSMRYADCNAYTCRLDHGNGTSNCINASCKECGHRFN